MKRCVVTGGAGFIGSHVVERLLADGDAVAVIDNFSRGRDANLGAVAGNANLRIHRADVADLEAIRPVFRGADAVFHLAALADIVPSIQQPLNYFRSNVNGTVSVMEAAREAGVKRIVYAASSSCYGIPDVFPTPETAPARPQYPYALTKLLGEETALHWGRVYRIPVVSLRFFNVYGPRARSGGTYGAVFGVFLAQRANGRPLTIVGDGTQTRDFTFVTDVADAVVAASRSGVAGEIMNVGSGRTVSVSRIAELIGGERVSVPKRPGEPDCTFADITKIQRLLGWRPRIGIEEGVRRLLDHAGDWKDAPVWTPSTIAEATRDWFKYLGNDAK